MAREILCISCMAIWLLFGLAIWWGLEARDHARDAKVVEFWQAYDKKMREFMNTPIESPGYKKLAAELYSMHPPSTQPRLTVGGSGSV